jgi:hypothetical protein
MYGRQEQVDAFGGFIAFAKEALTKCQWKGYRNESRENARNLER